MIAVVKPGETARLTYDWTGEGPPPREGDVLKTSTGRRYLVVSLRTVASSVSPCRLAIRGLVLAAGDEPEGPYRTYPLQWNRRSRSGS